MERYTTTTIALEIEVIVVLTVLNGVFAMSEVALLPACRSRLQLRAEHSEVRAGRGL